MSAGCLNTLVIRLFRAVGQERKKSHKIPFFLDRIDRNRGVFEQPSPWFDLLRTPPKKIENKNNKNLNPSHKILHTPVSETISKEATSGQNDVSSCTSRWPGGSQQLTSLGSFENAIAGFFHIQSKTDSPSFSWLRKISTSLTSTPGID